MSDSNYQRLVDKFIDDAFIISKASQLNPKIEGFNLCLDLFIQLFMEQKGRLIKGDIMVNHYIKLNLMNEVYYDDYSLYDSLSLDDFILNKEN